MRPRIARSVVIVPERKRDGMSPKYKAAIKLLPCIGCGTVTRPRDPHHLMRGIPAGSRGMGITAPDKWLLPLCRRCHDAAHKGGDDEAWLTGRGIDGRGVASVLWSERDEPKRMLRVIVRSLNDRRIYVG